MSAQRKPQFAAEPLAESTHNDTVMFKVRDLCATAGKRVHEMADQDSRPVKFEFLDHHDAIDVPYRFALKFAAIDGFEVTDGAGRRIRTVRETTRQVLELDKNQVVATFEELTTESLHKRAGRAGGNFKKNASRVELIAFLTSMDGIRLADGDTAMSTGEESEAAEGGSLIDEDESED